MKKIINHYILNYIAAGLCLCGLLLGLKDIVKEKYEDIRILVELILFLGNFIAFIYHITRGLCKQIGEYIKNT